MQEDTFSMQDLVLITLYAIAVSTAKKDEATLAFGHVRQVFLPLVKSGKDPARRPFLPFAEDEWKLLEDYEGFWRALKAELGFPDDTSLRITIPRERLARYMQAEGLTATISKTLCYGRALKAFDIL